MKNQTIGQSPEPLTRGGTKPPKLAALLFLLALLGSSYLAWAALSNSPIAGCGTGSGCDKVMGSRWAYWLNIPVSVPAALTYLALVCGIFLSRQSRSPDDERGTWIAIILLSTTVIGAGLWFMALQAFYLKAFCKFCLGIHACGLTGAVLCLSQVPITADPNARLLSEGSGVRGVPKRSIFPLVATGILALVVLAGGQVLFEKPRNLVVVLPKAGNTKPVISSPGSNSLTKGGPASAAQMTNGPAGPNARMIGPRLLSVYDGQFLFPLDSLPMIGSPASSNAIVYLFDYACPHCRELHHILTETEAQLSNQVGILALPMPMATNCNSLIPADFVSNSNSCDYARLGLAVWRARPDLHADFEEWCFEPAQTPTVAQVREYAAQLVGTNALEAALSDPWVEQQIAVDCRLHFANWQALGRPAMPQLIIGEAISLGNLVGVDHLKALLAKYLGMRVTFEQGN